MLVLFLEDEQGSTAYRSGDGRSNLQAGSMEDILDPVPETALDNQGGGGIGFMETGIYRLQLSKGCGRIEIECHVGWRLEILDVSLVPFLVVAGLTEGAARASRAPLENGGIGPAAARAERAARTRKRRMVVDDDGD